jgi:TM2 domain-containing membrane protein YozV
VWVLAESNEPGVGSDPSLSDHGRQGARVTARLRRHANPALAFSLSLLIWGGGQVYTRHYQLGVLYFLLMTNFYLFLWLLVTYWRPLTALLKTFDISSSQLLVPCGAFVVAGLLLWIVNAIHAYALAGSDRAEAFEGVSNPVLPALCSLLLPGWGQFLNGQMKKGACFLIIAMVGLFSVGCIVLVPYLWPTLEETFDRLFVERVLLVAVLLSPLALLLWGVSAYDALRVGLDPLKKEPLHKRFEYALNRMRMKGWPWVLRRVELTVMFGLYLVFLLALSQHYFPQDYYAAKLKNLQVRTAERHMVLIPRQIDRFLYRVFPTPHLS